jgi:acyl carrier protein
MVSDKLKSEILKELRLDDYEIKDETQLYQIPGWDSLNHINIIIAIEQEYKVRFKSLEIVNCKNISDLQKLCDSKIVM